MVTNEQSAGLIEAAEWHEQRAEEFRIEAEQAGEPSPAPQVATHLASAYEFRRRVARAADQEREMTDEERKKLCGALRLQGRASPSWGQNISLEAADEIERLQSENDWLRTALRAAQIAEQQSGMQ